MAALCALVLCAAMARAEDRDRQNFWESLIAPNEAEIQLVLDTARALRRQAFNHAYPTPDLGAPNAHVREQMAIRDSMMREALGMLRYAYRELNPRHPQVLLELGRTADDLQRPREAAAALEAYLNVAPPSQRERGDALIRLGHIYAARGDWDDAVAALRGALATASRDYELQAALSLGCAYMHLGRLDDAISVLSRGATVQPGRPPQHTESIAFALAIAYDRDEQITQAYDLLASLTARDVTLSGVLGQDWGHPLSTIPEPLLTPPAERHYFAAMRYEATNKLIEARTEWRAYVRAVERGPYVARASAHVAAIDAMLDADMSGKTAKP